MTSNLVESDDYRNSVVVDSESEDPQQIFKELDVDGNGQLDAEEVALLATRLGKDMSPDELQQAMTEMDTDGDGLAVPRASSLCDGLSKGL